MRHDAPASMAIFVCDYAAPYAGNFIPSLTALCDALNARSIPCALLFPQAAQTRAWCRALQNDGRNVLFLPRTGLFADYAVLRPLLLAHPNAILHAHFGLFPLCRAACLLHRHVRLFLHVHSDFSAGKKPTCTQRVKRAVNRFADVLIGRKRVVKISVSEFEGTRVDGCISVHNALVTSRCRLTDETRVKTRAAFGVSNEQTLVTVFGWSPYVKGVDVAAKAVARLHEMGQTDFVLAVVGGTRASAEQLRAFLRAHTVLTGTEAFLRFPPTTEDVFAYHAATDLFLSASRSETFSYALLEALYTGRMCVASDIAGVRWCARYGDAVRFYPAEDDALLANALLCAKRAALDPAFAERASAIHVRIEQDYGIDAWIGGILNVYGL